MARIKASNLSDELWAKIEPLIPTPVRLTDKKYQRAPGGGRKPMDARKMIAAILYVLRNGASWRASPKHLGSVPTLYRHFKMLQKSGFFTRLGNAGWIDSELKGIDWPILKEAEGGSRLKASESNVRPPLATLALKEREPRLSDPRVQTLLLRLHGAMDTAAFWKATQALFGELIPNNSMITYLDYFDYSKTWRVAKILATSNATMPREWFERRWRLDMTPSFLHSHLGIKFFRMSDLIADPRELQGTDYFKQFFKPFGWHYTASLCYWRGADLSSIISLRRTREQGDYRPGEIELLKKLHPHVETVLKRLLSSHRELSKGNWLGEFGQYLPLPLLLLDWSLKPVYVNREAMEQCVVWNFGPDKARAYDPRAAFRIPAEVAQACKELKARWLSGNEELACGKPQKVPSRLTHPKFQGYSASIMLKVSETLITKPGFLIYFDNPNAAHTSNYLCDQAILRLTLAERNLFRLASKGYGNNELALRLNKSVNTVKHQLTSIYRKLEVVNRREQFGKSRDRTFRRLIGSEGQAVLGESANQGEVC